MQEFQPFCGQLIAEVIDASQVAARPREAGDYTKFDRVFGDGKYDGGRRGRPLGRQR
jgi:hypothetical protein